MSKKFREIEAAADVIEAASPEIELPAAMEVEIVDDTPVIHDDVGKRVTLRCRVVSRQPGKRDLTLVVDDDSGNCISISSNSRALK